VRDIALFVVLLPIYAAFLVASAAAIAVLLLASVVAIPARMVWALATGRSLGAGW